MKRISFIWLKLVASLYVVYSFLILYVHSEGCPPSDAILPCRCSLRGKEMQIWCSHSNLPQIITGLKAIEHNVKGSIDELVLENNQLPALPGRFFGTLQVVRLMLRYNGVERVSNGWLNDLENSLVEIYMVEPQLRSLPLESLNGMLNIMAVTIQSEELKHLPNFSELLSLNYLNVQSKSLKELQSQLFRHLPKLQNAHINGGSHMSRLELGLFDNLISLRNIDLSHNAINWIHLRAFTRLPNVISLKLSHNEISDVGMVGRLVKDLENLKKLRLDNNAISIVEDGSFVDLPHLLELHLNDNRIIEIQYGAFLRTPELKTIYLHNNHIRHIHPESFLQASGSGVETIYIYNNEIEQITELRSLLDSLPALKFLDISNNYITNIPYGELRGHGTLEQLHLNNNLLRIIDRDAFMAMPALRELRMRNNSLSNELPMPFWNLPGLKGLDLAKNQFHIVGSSLLSGLPLLRRLDLSENELIALDPTVFMYNPMLETLNISGNQLVTIHPETFRNLYHLFEVDASYNRLTEIIPGLPTIVERISLRGNLITSLPTSSILTLKLHNLRMLDLSANMIEYIPKYGFQGVKELRVLSLAYNRLRTLDDTTFIGTRRLELLHLQDNALAYIDERAFLGLPELRNLNLQGNKLQFVTDNLLSNNSNLELLDLSHNQIHSIAPTSFDAQRALEYLDLSNNALSDISISLANLINLQDIDLSYNQISKVHADIVSAWQNAFEIRLSNNVITVLTHGTFKNLTQLQYLDLSSNEITSIEPGALKHLPDLQEFVLADNKLVEIKDRVFEDMPNLLAAHFQFNALQYISPDSFYNTPSMVFLNLSNNNFRSMDHIGLRNMRNLEVLDLSTNGVKIISTMPLRALNWLVELKMDNNEICKIQGSPFETMPRLRVLSLRNNRLRMIKEPAFRNIRANIAVLDVYGNPIICSCAMQWLSVWLQETKFPYPGPKCQDGRLLRNSRIEKCSEYNDTNQRTEHLITGLEIKGLNNLPLLNEHGDLFQRELAKELSDACEVVEVVPGERPSVGESEYFYDQYIDYSPTNEVGLIAEQPSLEGQMQSELENKFSNHQLKPVIYSNVEGNKTILNTNYFKKRPNQLKPEVSSSFTFFGYPMSGLNFGRFFGVGNRGRKQRIENNTNDIRKSSASMPSTHRSMHITSTNGKVRMLQPNSAEFEKYLKHEGNHELKYNDTISRNVHIDITSDETFSNEEFKGMFRTTVFREPSNVERGGFRPIVPEHISGFIPINDPKFHKVNNKIKKNIVNISSNSNYTPISMITNTELKNAFGITHLNDSVEKIVITTANPVELNTYFITEKFITPNNINLATDGETSKENTNMDATSSLPITTLSTDTPGFNFYDDLNAQSEGMLQPQQKIQTTTPETILLIPPPEEHVEQIKRLSWISSSTLKNTEPFKTASTTMETIIPVDRSIRPTGGRSTITKVFAAQSFNRYVPLIDEYYRTTPFGERADTVTQPSQDAQNRHFYTSEHMDNSMVSVTEKTRQKEGMDWYYDSFKMVSHKGNHYRSRYLSNDKLSSNAKSYNIYNIQSIVSKYYWLFFVMIIFS